MTASDDIGRLEVKMLKAKADYQSDPSDEKLKEKHRAASQALSEARQETRGGIPDAKDSEDVSVTPMAASAAGSPGKVN